MDRAERRALWAEKMRRNQERDQRSTRLAQEHGWTVVRVWECQVRLSADDVAHHVLDPQGSGPPAVVHRRVSPS